MTSKSFKVKQFPEKQHKLSYTKDKLNDVPQQTGLTDLILTHFQLGLADSQTE